MASTTAAMSDCSPPPPRSNSSSTSLSPTTGPTTGEPLHLASSTPSLVAEGGGEVVGRIITAKQQPPESPTSTTMGQLLCGEGVGSAEQQAATQASSMLLQASSAITPSSNPQTLQQFQLGHQNHPHQHHHPQQQQSHQHHYLTATTHHHQQQLGGAAHLQHPPTMVPATMTMMDAYASWLPTFGVGAMAGMLAGGVTSASSSSVSTSTGVLHGHQGPSSNLLQQHHLGGCGIPTATSTSGSNPLAMGCCDGMDLLNLTTTGIGGGVDVERGSVGTDADAAMTLMGKAIAMAAGGDSGMADEREEEDTTPMMGMELLQGSGRRRSNNDNDSGSGGGELGRVKRPMNAFMVYSRLERRKIAAENPHMPNTEISKLLALGWRQLDDEVKARFVEEARALGQQHRRLHPDYKYSRTTHKMRERAAADALMAGLGSGSVRRKMRQQPTTGGVADAIRNSGSSKLLQRQQLPSLACLAHARGKLTCPMCLAEFGGDNNTAAPNASDPCFINYAAIDELEAHVAGEHFNCLPYECEKCRYSKFPTEYAVRRHVDDVHQLAEYKITCRITAEISAKKKEIGRIIHNAMKAYYEGEGGEDITRGGNDGKGGAGVRGNVRPHSQLQQPQQQQHSNRHPPASSSTVEVFGGSSSLSSTVSGLLADIERSQGLGNTSGGLFEQHHHRHHRPQHSQLRETEEGEERYHPSERGAGAATAVVDDDNVVATYFMKR